MAVILVSAGFAHVMNGSAAELAGNEWPRRASTRKAQYLLFTSVVSSRLFQARLQDGGGRDKSQSPGLGHPLHF